MSKRFTNRSVEAFHKKESPRPGEFELIERIKASLGETGENLIKGIGDDCAITVVSPGFQLLSTIDVLVEGVHFLRDRITPAQLGHKALAVNLSDIAAMGGLPRHALVSLCIPPDVDQKYIDELYAGMNRLAASAGASVVGGNISASPKDLVINVVLLGMVEEGKALLRSGARPGDLLFVTGELGLSAAGVELLKGSRLETKESGPCDAAGSAPLKAAMDKHHTPTPRVKEGRLLMELGCATAAIDLSDGLASDLRHICKESGVGVIIYSEKLPVASGVFALNDALTAPPIDYALFGGEDYELLVTIQRDKAKELKSSWGGDLAPITEVGIITERDEGIKLLDERGKSAELPSGGWDHLEAARDLD